MKATPGLVVLISWLLGVASAPLPGIKCDASYWPEVRWWNGPVDMDISLTAKAISCCSPVTKYNSSAALACNNLLQPHAVVGTFMAPQLRDPLVWCPVLNDFNVKIGVRLSGGLLAMVRFSKHGASADFLAYAINQLLGLHNTPRVTLHAVSKPWLSEMFLSSTQGLHRPNDSEGYPWDKDDGGANAGGKREESTTVNVSFQLWAQGSVAYYGEDGLPYSWHTMLAHPESMLIPPVWKERLLELSDAAVFDYIIANTDRFQPVPWGVNILPQGIQNAVSKAQAAAMHNERLKQQYHFSLDRLLNSFNTRLLFPGGPLLLIDHTDAFLNQSAFSCGKQCDAPNHASSGYLLGDICVFRASTVIRLTELSKLPPHEWLSALLSASSPSPGTIDPWMLQIGTEFGLDLLRGIQWRVRASLAHVEACASKYTPARTLLPS